MSECQECKGKGYVLKHHARLTCDECGGRGVLSQILGKPLTALELKRENRKADLTDKIEDLEDSIDTKESQIDDLEDEIDCLRTEVGALRRERERI